MSLLAIHSLLRYVVLAAAALSTVWLLFRLVTRSPPGRDARVAGAAFVGLLDLQILLGLATFAVQPYYPALIGHIVTMLLAAALAHGLLIVHRRRAASGYGLPLVAVAGSTALVVAGIYAIGRAPL